MKKIFCIKIVFITSCILFAINIISYGKNDNTVIEEIVPEIEDNVVLSENIQEGTLGQDYDYQSYEIMLREAYLRDNEIPLKERVYSEYNLPFKIFEQLSLSVIGNMYNTDYDMEEKIKLFEGMGYNKTASFIKKLFKISPKTIPEIKSNECFIHNGKYETRTILLFPDNELITINIAYNKAIPYLYFADNIGFQANGLIFDAANNSISMLDDYCVSKGEKINQYSDMDDFINNFVLATLFIIIFIIVISHYNKKEINNNKTNTIKNDIKSKDNELIAIITAAIAAYENTSENSIKIKTIKKNIRWKNI